MPVRYLLDSDICIFVMKRRSPGLLRRLDQRAPSAAISVVAYGELAFGEAVSARRTEAAAHLAALLEILQVLPLPLEAARRYAGIRAELQRSGDRSARTICGSRLTRLPTISRSSPITNASFGACRGCASKTGPGEAA